MSEPPVTRRYAAPVTHRFEAENGAGEAITRRYESPIRDTAQGVLRQDAFVAGRYRVLEGPLGLQSGEAEVYRCLDEQLKKEVAVKIYRYDATPKQEVIVQLAGLAHPNILQLHGFGHWAGRFYEVTELCEGGVLADIMALSEEQLLGYLPGIVQGLDFCHRQGIVHRDLKPNNLFLRDAARTQPLIGDFGISSYLDRDDSGVRETRTAASLTLDYAAPELIDGHQVSAKTDYYGLGITLMHLLAGRSPFHGLSPNDVLVAHLRGRVPLPEGVSARFTELLRGLTLGQPTARWGSEQVRAWLRGEQVAVDLRHASWSTAAREGRPYPGWPSAKTPAELAAALDRFPAADQLQRGDIRRWVFDYFDTDMAERIEELEQIASEYPDLAAAKLRYLLDPRSPLDLGDLRFGTLADLADFLRGPQSHEQRSTLEKALGEGLVESWIEAGQLAGARTTELLQALAELRERLPGTLHREAALDALIFILTPGEPIRLPGGESAATPHELALAFERDATGLGPFLQQLLFSRRLEEWIRAMQLPDGPDLVAFLGDLRLRYLEHPLVAVHCFCWHFHPEMPFQLGDIRITRPEQLATLIDRDPEYKREGLKMLEEGWIRAWLVGSGRITDVAALDQALLAMDLSPRAKMEALLRLLDPRLPTPKLEVDRDVLYFGRIPSDGERTLPLRVRNSSRGYLNGDIKLATYGAGLSLDNYQVDGNDNTIQVTISAIGLDPGKYATSLHLVTNGGEKEVSVMFSVREPEDPRPAWLRFVERFLPD